MSNFEWKINFARACREQTGRLKQSRERSIKSIGDLCSFYLAILYFIDIKRIKQIYRVQAEIDQKYGTPSSAPP
jgi:hypothetical protein